MSGKKWHHPKCWYTEELRNKLKERASRVAHELIKEGKANRVVFVDDIHFEVKGHFHLQLCLR